MQIEVYGQQLEVTPPLRSYVETRFERLGRRIDSDCEIRVQLAIEKPSHKATATVNLTGRTLHGDALGPDMYAAIDLLVDKLDRLLVKHKEKLTEQRRGDGLARSSGIG